MFHSTGSHNKNKTHYTCSCSRHYQSKWPKWLSSDVRAIKDQKELLCGLTDCHSLRGQEDKSAGRWDNDPKSNFDSKTDIFLLFGLQKDDNVVWEKGLISFNINLLNLNQYVYM